MDRKSHARIHAIDAASSLSVVIVRRPSQSRDNPVSPGPQQLDEGLTVVELTCPLMAQSGPSVRRYKSLDSAVCEFCTDSWPRQPIRIGGQSVFYPESTPPLKQYAGFCFRPMSRAAERLRAIGH